jgi:PAS domain S-box-containing protein
MLGAIRLLQVDDDPGFAELTATFLEQEDEAFEVTWEPTAAEALDRVGTATFDCIVSDYEMPGQNGLELLDKIRQQYPDLPFVLFTGKGSEEVASDAISAGVTDYLQKARGPDQFAVLANRVRNAVERWHAQREAQRTQTVIDALTEQSNELILVINGESIIQFASEASETIFGYPPEQLKGRSMTDLMPERYRVVHNQSMARYLETNRQSISWRSVDFVGLHRAGHEIPVSVSFSEFEDEGELRFVGTIRDIEERWVRERERQEWLEFFQRIYQLTTNRELTFEEKLDHLLAAGSEHLNLPYGFLTRIETTNGTEQGTQTITRAYGNHDAIEVGTSCSLSESYCRQTIINDGFLTVPDAVASGWAEDPAYKRFDLGSYIGASVEVHDELYGTLCFASHTPCRDTFSETEESFVQLVAKWAGYEMERQRL